VPDHPALRLGLDAPFGLTVLVGSDVNSQPLYSVGGGPAAALIIVFATLFAAPLFDASAAVAQSCRVEFFYDGRYGSPTAFARYSGELRPNGSLQIGKTERPLVEAPSRQLAAYSEGVVSGETTKKYTVSIFDTAGQERGSEVRPIAFESEDSVVVNVLTRPVQSANPYVPPKLGSIVRYNIATEASENIVGPLPGLRVLGRLRDGSWIVTVTAGDPAVDWAASSTEIRRVSSNGVVTTLDAARRGEVIAFGGESEDGDFVFTIYENASQRSFVYLSTGEKSSLLTSPRDQGLFVRGEDRLVTDTSSSISSNGQVAVARRSGTNIMLDLYRRGKKHRTLNLGNINPYRSPIGLSWAGPSVLISGSGSVVVVPPKGPKRAYPAPEPKQGLAIAVDCS
jgi:hypothetical protein